MNCFGWLPPKPDGAERENLADLGSRLFGIAHGVKLDLQPRGGAPGRMPPDPGGHILDEEGGARTLPPGSPPCSPVGFTAGSCRSTGRVPVVTA